MNNQQELIDEYLYYCLKQRKLDEKTVRAYRIDLRQFSEFCVQKKLVTEKSSNSSIHFASTRIIQTKDSET